MKNIIYILKTSALLLGLFLIYSCQEKPSEATTITVTGTIENDTTWVASNNYILDKQVTVPKGVTLTIEPGTVIKANPGEAPQVSMLVVAKGGKLNAQGTEEKPIVFTSINDNFDPKNNVSSALSSTDVGLWGGIIILGDAPVALPSGEKEAFYVGLNPNSDSSYYGGENSEDTSGVIEYVSIRHGGIFIGTGSESNGITLCGVGSGTKINNIEIFANQDDGIELFGGTVNVENILIHGSGDDAIDIDEGFSGTINNFLIELNESSDSALEITGVESDANSSFTLSKGYIDGENFANSNLYTMNKQAEGKIEGLALANVEEGIQTASASEKVKINFIEAQEKPSKEFQWARSRQ